MKDFWIFPTLAVILVVTVYLGSTWILIFLLLVILRIGLLKNVRLLILSFILMGIFLIRCQFLNQTAAENVSQIKTVVLSPDNLVVKGNSLSGELRSGKDQLRFIYSIKNQPEQNFWQNLSTMASATVTVKKIEKIAGPRNPGEFDFQRYSANKGLKYTVQLDTIRNLKKYDPQTIFEKINVLRIHIINYLKKLPKWMRIQAQSLIVGYNDPLEKDFLEILSVLGIIHLFSLSGLHVLILLTMIRKLTSFFRIPVEWVDTVLLILLPCYGILVGSRSGIWRAIVLAMVGIIFGKFKLKYTRLDIFSITLLICLWIYPFTLAEMGGQLSFLLSFAILYLYRGSKLLLTTLKMILVGLPVICFYTYQFNWLTLLINLIFVPIFTYLILPFTIISSLTVGWPLWKIPNNFFGWMYGLFDKIAHAKNLIFVTGQIPSFWVIILIIIVLLYVETKTLRNKYLWIYMLIFIGCVAMNKFPLFGSVNLVDVGQGDSLVITTPLNRKTFMIDVAGKLRFPMPSWAKHETSNQVDNSTIPFLKHQGISRIDKLFLTHKDVDHVGNLEIMLSKFSVKEVNFGIGLENNPRIQAAMKHHPEVKFKNLQQDDVVDTGFIKWRVLWPKTKGIGENGDSLTLLARIKNKKWLFTGDLDSESEKEILKDHQFQADYLKVGHHGSKTATSDQLLSMLKPKVGFISAGVNNRYGHPNKETLKRLQKHQVQYFNTADYGMISWYYYFFNNEEKITTFLKGDLVENSRTKE